MIALSIILVLSLAVNIFFIVYLRWLLTKFAFLSENIGDIISSMSTFSEHLGAIHDLETYYGDTTLENLVQHSKQIVREIEIYKDIYTLFNEENDAELEKLFEKEEEYVKNQEAATGEE